MMGLAMMELAATVGALTAGWLVAGWQGVAVAVAGWTVGAACGNVSLTRAIRQSGYAIERLAPNRYRIGVVSPAPPVPIREPAVDWIVTPIVDGKAAGAIVGALGHKPRGGGRP